MSLVVQKHKNHLVPTAAGRAYSLHPSEESGYNLNKPGDDSCSLTIDADTLHSAHTPDRTSPAFWQMGLFAVGLRQRPGLAFPLIALLLLPRSVLHHLLQGVQGSPVWGLRVR